MNDGLRMQLLKLVALLAIIFGIVVGVLRWQYVDVVAVANDAMAPTVFGGDEVFVWRTHEFDHGDIVEWWTDAPAGFEQGWDEQDGVAEATKKKQTENEASGPAALGTGLGKEPGEQQLREQKDTSSE
jgi:signal peptidase I